MTGHATTTRSPPHSGSLLRLIFAGGIITLLLFSISAVSSLFSYGVVPRWTETIFVISCLFISGTVLLFCLPLLKEPQLNKQALVWIFLLGGLARLVFIGSEPIYEDDWYRYLWDGAVLRTGINPYLHPPAAAELLDIFGTPVSGDIPETQRALQALGAATPLYPERINYPFITTIYPPVAMVFFGLSDLISRFNLDVWRLILLTTDSIGFFLIIKLLVSYRMATGLSALYWWNPIVIMTGFNAAHMDILLVPFLMASLLFNRKKRPGLAAIALGAAAGIKLWPILLAPVLFRKYFQLKISSLRPWIFLTTSLLVFLGPFVLSALTKQSGFLAYSTSWQTNSFVFSIVSNLATGLFPNADLLIRALVAILLISYTLFLTKRIHWKKDQTEQALLSIIILLFLVSPTGYPWYAIWFFMFAPFIPSLAVMSFCLTLPIYYSRFLLETNHHDWVFNYILVPIEFGIPIVLIYFSFNPDRKFVVS